MRQVATYLYLLAFFMLLLSCRKENTIWTSSWSIPIINDSLSLNNLSNDSIFKEENNQYSICLNKSLYKIKLSDYLSIPDTTISTVIGIIFPSITVNPGTTLSENNTENVLNIADAQLKRIQIKEGVIELTLKNPLQTKVYYTIEIPSMSINGNSVKKRLEVNAGTTTNPTEITSTIDLAGYDVDLTGLSGNSFNTILTSFSLQLDPLGKPIKVTNQDKSTMDISMKNIKLDYARGYFGNLKLADTKTIYLDGVNKITSGNLNLNKGNVELSIVNSCKISARGRINNLSNSNIYTKKTITLTNNQLSNPFFITSASGNANNYISTTKTISLNESNSNILPFIENLGSKYNIDYNFEINPFGNLSGGWDEFDESSTIDIRLLTNIPLTFRSENLTIKDTFNTNFSEYKQKITKGKLHLESTNYFPLTGNLQLVFLNDNNKTIETIISNSPILGKEIDKNAPTVSYCSLELTPKLINNISMVKKILIISTFNTPNIDKTSMYTLDSNSKLAFKVYTNFTIENKY